MSSSTDRSRAGFSVAVCLAREAACAKLEKNRLVSLTLGCRRRNRHYRIRLSQRTQLQVRAESGLEQAQCFTGNGHGRSAGYAQTNDDVMKVGSLMELSNTANRAPRKDLTRCAGVGGIGGQAVDSWLGLKHRPKASLLERCGCGQLREE
jgi:hypothetical protein